MLLVVVAGFFTPWLIRNVILSGYLLFPFPYLDLFSVDWKVPAGRVLSVQNDVLSFGRIPNLPIHTVIKMDFAEWFPLWLERATVVRRALFTMAMFSPLLVLFRFLFLPRINWYFVGLYFCMYLGLIYWLFSAPDFRFGFGFIFGTLVVATYFWLNFRWPVLFLRVAGVALVLLSVVYPAYLMAASLENSSLSRRVLMPVEYKSPPVDTCVIGDSEIFCSRIYGWCGYETFPCAPKIRLDIKLRGNDWQQGFRDESP
jgi:hypothetical protein